MKHMKSIKTNNSYLGPLPNNLGPKNHCLAFELNPAPPASALREGFHRPTIALLAAF